jgi:hypothetical protein
MRSLIYATRRVIKKRRMDGTTIALSRRFGGLRQRISATALSVIVAMMLVVGSGIAGNDKARAAPMCPGPTTSDGLACCAPGSTPTGADTCQLPGGGGVAASCALSQLTSSGTCCPASSSPQADGSCQPANGFASAPGCPLGQLGKSGLSCCPTGQIPQADGSCQQTTAQPSTAQPSATQQPAAATPASVSPCPVGFEYSQQDNLDPVCTGLPIGCPAGTQAFIGIDPGAFAVGCCPPGTQPGSDAAGAAGRGFCVTPNGSSVDDVAPSCPAGSTADYNYNPGVGHNYMYWFCQAKPSCPGRLVLDRTLEVCDVNPALLQVTPGKLLNAPTPPARPPPSTPCPAGDERAPDGGCVKVIPGAVLPGCSAGYTMSPDGKMCVRAAETPVGPAPIGPVGIPAGPKPIAPVGTPTTAAPTAKTPGETTALCPPGESQVPGAKPGTCKSCPSGTHPNADGACVRTTTNKPTTPIKTPATTKTTSPTTKLTTPTRTTSKPPKLHVTNPKLIARPPKKSPAETPAKTTS